MHDHRGKEGRNKNNIKARQGPTQLCNDQTNISEGLPGTCEITNTFSKFPGNLIGLRGSDV